MTGQSDLDDIKQAIQSGQGNISLTALLQALMPTLSDEARETVRQALASQQAQRVNRGVVVTGPEGLDGIDPLNAKNAALMHKQPGVLYNFGFQGSTLAGFSEDRTRFVIVAGDLVEQRRRHIIEIILHDYLGDKPALELAGPDLAPGLFLFSGTKTFPRELSEKNAKKLVDYFEEAQADRWYYQYWRLADERSREVCYWLATEQKGAQS